MHTRSLKTLVRVSALGSFAKVAEEMNTTISTVSMQIKSLEEQLDLDIFDRSHRPPQLTPVGRMVCERAKVILDAEREMLGLSGKQDVLNGNFRIGFIPTASVRLLPSFLKNARETQPNASFELETALSEVLELRVQSGMLDAAIVTESGQRKSDLNYHLIRSEPLMFAVPKAFEAMDITEIRKHVPFLQFNPGSGIGKIIQRYMSHGSDSAGKQDVVLESVEAIVECVNEGLGFTLLAKPDIARYATEKCFVTPMRSEMLSRRISLVMPRGGVSDAICAPLLALFNKLEKAI